MLARDLLDKRHQVAIKAVNLLLRNEAEDIHLAVHAIVQLPAVTRQRNRSNGAASRRNGTSAAESTDPDHDFVLWVAAGFGRGEKVVGDVCNEVSASVGPLPDGGQRFYGREGFLGDFCYDVGVRLDVSLTAEGVLLVLALDIRLR